MAILGRIPRRVIGPKELETTSTKQYTVPFRLSFINEIYVIERTSTVHSVNLQLKPAGVGLGLGHKLLAEYKTLANDMRAITGMNIPLARDDEIWADASGGGVNIIVVVSSEEEI
jgi:hypothetical protein